MTFEYGDYLRECFSQPMMILLPLLILFAYLIYAAIRISRRQPKPGHRAWMSVILFIPLLVCAPAANKQIKTLVQTNGFAILQDSNAEPLTLTGSIEAIRQPERSVDTRYTYDGKTCYGAWLTIGGEEYYAMTEGDFAVGDAVTIEYLPKSRCVLYLAPAESTNAEE